MKKILLLTGFILLPLYIQAQVIFNGNANSGFGNPVGNSSLSVTNNATAVNFNFTKGSSNFNDMLVIYISNGNAGRTAIDGAFNDANDDFRRAVCITGSGTANFPAGFRATHAIAIRQGTANQASPLFTIPAAGNVGSGALPFIKHVGNPTSSTQVTFTFTFNWSDIGLTSSDQFSFVAVYGNPNDSNNSTMFLSNEGYGGGFPGTNVGTGTLNVSTYLQYPSGLRGGNASTTVDGLWLTNGIWANGNPPLSTDAVTIAHNVTLDTSTSVGTITVNNSRTFTASDATSRTLTIANSGTITNNGTFTASNGTVAFAGAGIVTGTIGFNNVTIAGGVNFGTASTVGPAGFLQINGGGFIGSNAPTYNSNSTLIYNIDGNYGRGLEWSATSGRGYPGNVQIGNGSNNTIFDLGANSGATTARQCAGNLTINSGSSLTLNNTGNIMNQRLTVLGNVANFGTLTLSGTIGGDLAVQGNITDNGTTNFNTRAVFFEGGNVQNIQGSGTFDIPFVRINKSAGRVVMGSNLTCVGVNVQNALEISGAASILDLNGFILNLGAANNSSTYNSGVVTPGSIRGSAASTLNILGTGALGTINYDQTTPGTTNALSNFSINRTASGSVTLGTPLTVVNSLTIGSESAITNGTLSIEGLITDNRTIKTYTGTIQYSGAAQTVVAGSYNNLSLLNSGLKTFGGNTTISGEFVVNTATAAAPTLLTFNGGSAQNIAGLAFNNIEFSGSGAKTFTSNASVNATSAMTFAVAGATVDFDGTANDLVFELNSNVNGTARVGNATGSTLNGEVTVERFIPAKRAWRILTAPLRGSANNSIFANWQNNGATVVNTTGLLLWNPAGTATPLASNNGFFFGLQPNVRSYTNGAFQNVNNSNATLLFTATENNPFLVFVTGPHANTATLTGTAVATTARATGTLVTGTVTKDLNANQFTLIGNPYASPINPASLIDSNLDAKLWLINPSTGVGAYVTFDGNWSIPPLTVEDGYIQSGQGFFARTVLASTFTINETDKVTGNSNNWFERNASDEAVSESVDKIRVLLYKQEASNWTIADGILSVNQASGSNEVDGKDAGKISNFNESLMFRNNTSNLSIEYRSLPQTGEMQPLRMTGTVAIPYQFRVYTEEYTNSTLQPYLQDTQAGTLTAIPMDGTQLTVPFTGVVSTTTNPDNRFRIVYQTNLNTVETSPLVVSIFPNPVTNNQLNIHLGNNTNTADYSITNLLGQSIQKGQLATTQNVITLSSASQGFYILSIKQDGKSFTTKIYVQ